MVNVFLLIVFGFLAYGMMTSPWATLPFAVVVGVLITLFIAYKILWPSKKDNTKPETYAILDILAHLSPWH